MTPCILEKQGGGGRSQTKDLGKVHRRVLWLKELIGLLLKAEQTHRAWLCSALSHHPGRKHHSAAALCGKLDRQVSVCQDTACWVASVPGSLDAPK